MVQSRIRTGGFVVGGMITLAVVGGIGLGMFAAVGATSPTVSPASTGGAVPSSGAGVAGPTRTPAPSRAPSPTSSPTPVPTQSPSPTPVPTQSLVQAPLTGRMVRPQVAKRRAIAVMIDDHPDARPQAGFNAASVVWHAPAEGGIPRYMLIFQDRIPESVGPVRSARQYYVAWAAEWAALYAHVGGSPQALDTLRRQGNGQLVYNADEFRWGGIYFHRSTDRFAPHNVYTTGKELRRLATRLGALDGPQKAAWSFGPAIPLGQRRIGGTIAVKYDWNAITYQYDRVSNTYLRSVTGAKKQVDAATGERVAPTNVVVMLMSFGPLNDGSSKGRLEAQYLGSGRAWIASNGHTIKGTWRKDDMTGPTRFFDGGGKPVMLSVGQTFVQVMPKGSKISIEDGKRPPRLRTGVEHTRL